MKSYLIIGICLFITLGCNCSDPTEEEQLILCENVVPGRYVFLKSNCTSSNPEFNMCHRTIIFQENSKALHLLNGGDIMTESNFSIEGNILTVWEANGETPVIEFDITNCNPIIDVNNGEIYKRSL